MLNFVPAAFPAVLLGIITACFPFINGNLQRNSPSGLQELINVDPFKVADVPELDPILGEPVVADEQQLAFDEFI